MNERNKMVYTNKEIESYILSQGIKNDIEYIIINCRGNHPCCYLGIPIDHPLTKISYNDIPLICHGGLTYGGIGGYYPKDLLPPEKYWLGWDYGHSGDYDRYSSQFNSFFASEKYLPLEGKKWVLSELEDEVWEVSYWLRKLLKLLSKIEENK